MSLKKPRVTRVQMFMQLQLLSAVCPEWLPAGFHEEKEGCDRPTCHLGHYVVSDSHCDIFKTIEEDGTQLNAILKIM